MVTHFVFEGRSHICHMYSLLSFSSIYTTSAPSNFFHASHFLGRRLFLLLLVNFCFLQVFQVFLEAQFPKLEAILADNLVAYTEM